MMNVLACQVSLLCGTLKQCWTLELVRSLTHHYDSEFSMQSYHTSMSLIQIEHCTGSALASKISTQREAQCLIGMLKLVPLTTWPCFCVWPGRHLYRHLIFVGLLHVFDRTDVRVYCLQRPKQGNKICYAHTNTISHLNVCVVAKETTNHPDT